ncbi:MAG TPA: SMC family ATPase [Candidatus Butyricimonas faecavium]|nr:SMC family ATPase [Candidatus Butyricimonas faecavium]
MLPVKLTLEGIYSYRERQTIDFTRLTEARLFGIFGSVGSGKSTILEAMIYAIYGTIDRLNNDVKYNVMNLQSDRLFVDFEFRAGEDERLYRATVECRRNRKRFADVSSPKYLYHVWEGDGWLPCTREEVVGAIGLTAQNFKRVVIIPQGKFQEFLMLRDKERTDMMMELFGELRRYDLGGRVAYLEGETTRQVIDLRGQLTGLGEVDRERLVERKQRYAALQEEIAEVKKDIREGQEQVDKLKKVKQLADERVARQEEERKLLERREAVAGLQARVDEYERCLQQFQQPLSRYDETGRRLAESTRVLSGYREQLATKQAELGRFSELFSRLKEAYEGRDRLKERARQLERLLQLRAIRKERDKLKERHRKGEETVVATRQEIELLQEHLQEQKERLGRLNQSIPDMKMLSDIREWYNIQQHIREELTRLQEELAGVDKDITREEEEIKAVRQEYPAFEALQGVTCKVLQEFCRERREQLAAAVEKAREEWLHLNTRQRLVDFAKELSEGEPCPLCGALSHPMPLRTAEVEGELKEKADRMAGLEEEGKLLDRMVSRLVVIGERLRSAGERKEQITRQQFVLQERLREHLNRFTWEGFVPDNMQHLTDEMDRVALLNKEKHELEAMRGNTEKSIEQKRGNLEKYVARLDEINREIVQRDSQAGLLREQQAGFDERGYEEVSDTEIGKELEGCRQRFEQIGRDYQRDAARLQVIEADFRKWEGSVEEKSKEVGRLQQELEGEGRELERLLKDSTYLDLAAVREVLSGKLDLPMVRGEINRYREQVHAVQVRKAELEVLLAGVSYNAEEHVALCRRVEAALVREREMLAEQGALGNQIKDMETRVAAREKIGRELEGLESRLMNLQVLKGLFRGNDFVKFVSSIYLQNLCNAANERFYRMTRQRLKLELSEENDFVVRDFMNEGRVRSARTLSGGQIFQASLSLALALTDNIRHLTGSNQNFFFLDEGFGSLDRESLSVVFETLKSLRAENRVVGLISHVEEMQQEVPACLFVENTVERGSVVEFKV